MPDNRFASHVPAFTRTWSAKGDPLPITSEADVILIRHSTLWATAIAGAQALGEVAHPEWKGYTWTNHTGVSRKMADGSMGVSQMGPRGYERVAASEYVDKEACVIHFDVSDELRANAVRNDEAMSGIDYGWLEYLPDVINEFTHEDLAVTIRNHVVCSAHAALVVMGLGFFPPIVPTGMMPVQWALLTDARPPAVMG